MPKGYTTMRFSLLVYRGLLSSLMVLFAGCAVAPPTQEMSNARQAIEVAREAGADEFAPANLRRAEERLDMAGEEIEARAFRDARRDALSARRQAQRALEIVRALEVARQAIAEAEKVGNDASEARRLLEQAHAAARRGDDDAALRLAEQARERVYQPLPAPHIE